MKDDAALVAELIAAAEQGIRRIEQLDESGQDLGPDPTIERLQKAIAAVKRARKS